MFTEKIGRASPSTKGTDLFLSLRVEELKYNNYSR